MLEHFSDYGYIGIFLALLAAGCGFPMPEELPVIMAGIIVGHDGTTLKWYLMLPVVIAGVVLGDTFLYGMGRYWGDRLLKIGWVQRHFVPPDKRAEIEKNFQDRGVMVLLSVRLLPGIRTPVFIMAGVLRVPFGRFLIADALYAIPIVNVMFWLSYFLTDQVLVVFRQLEQYRPLVMVAILSAVAGALFQKYVLTRKISTGEAPHVPPIIARPAGAVVHAVEKAVEAVAHVTHHKAEPPPPPPDAPPDEKPGGPPASV